jgi:hypothetical protein
MGSAVTAPFEYEYEYDYEHEYEHRCAEHGQA